jgi:hypothetical protein
MIQPSGNGRNVDRARERNSDPDLWCVNPWLTAHMIGAAHSQCDTAEQERGHAIFAALSEQSSASADAVQELPKENDERQRQSAALDNWEDEGGSTAAMESVRQRTDGHG